MPSPVDDVVSLCRDLIRIDTSNWGDSSQTIGEAVAAEYTAHCLQEVHLYPEVITTTSDARRAVHVRIPGSDPSADALVVHGHLDVVPAVAGDWTHPPFGAEVDDGFIWGRGAVDMKDMDAMILAVVRNWARTGVRPRRDIIVLFFPDEEAGSRHGSHWLVNNRPDLFAGATQAVGEVGGFSVTVRDDLRLYPIQTAEKGIRWLHLHARGRAGHGSLINDDNAVTALCAAVARIGSHEWPQRMTPTVSRFVEELSDAYGIDLTAGSADDVIHRLRSFGALVAATMQNTANPTMLSGGYKHNVIPEMASAAIDGRVLPGFEEEFIETVRRLAGDDVEVVPGIEDVAIESPVDAPIVDLMASVLREADPAARPVPYMISGGTDAKAMVTLGIDCYGFSPLQMPADLDYWTLFHGVDERVPIDGLAFGVQVLDRFLRQA